MTPKLTTVRHYSTYATPRLPTLAALGCYILLEACPLGRILSTSAGHLHTAKLSATSTPQNSTPLASPAATACCVESTQQAVAADDATLLRRIAASHEIDSQRCPLYAPNANGSIRILILPSALWHAGSRTETNYVVSQKTAVLRIMCFHSEVRCQHHERWQHALTRSR